MRKIMIVDDDSTSVAIGRAFLDDEYEIIVVRSGIQALGALKDDPLPDIVLLDVFMPGMDGMEVLKTMKKDDRLKDIPVIFLTGDKELDLEVEGYKNGAGDFLLKPVNRFLLKTKIKQYILFLDTVRENQELKKRLGL